MNDRDLLELLDALQEGVVLLRARRVRAMNREARRLLGIETGGIGAPVISVLRDHRLEKLALEGGTAEIELRGRVVAVRAVPGGLSLLEVSELRRAQTSARELLAVLSHELRTPVTAIHATLEALAYDLPPEQRARFLASAKAEAERLVRLLADLTVEVKPPQLRRVLLSDVSARALALLQDTFASHHVTVGDELPSCTVMADEDKLLQVLINLLENAAIHGPDGKSIYLRARKGEADTLEVVVQDEGQPLPPESIEKLFEPHSRGAGIKSKGTGLGLYIVRSIAQRWGGQAWGRALEDGNEFGVSLPLARD